MIRQIFSLSTNICGAIGFILNVILLFCIRYKSPKELSEMRYVLANMAISDIIIAIFAALTQMKILFHHPYNFWQPLGPVKDYGIEMSLIFACTCGFAFFHSTFSMAFGFYFRHKKVCRLASGSVLSLQKFSIVITLTGLLAAVLGFGLLFVKEDCDETISELLSQLGEDLDCNSVIAFQIESPGNLKFFNSKNTSRNTTVGFFWLMLLLSISVSIFYLIIATYLWKMHKFLRNRKANMSPETYTKLISFFKVNLSQAIFPIFTSLVPFCSFWRDPCCRSPPPTTLAICHMQAWPTCQFSIPSFRSTLLQLTGMQSRKN